MPASVTSVDIAICTWNRPDLLRRTLASFAQLRVPDSVELTVLIVDNNSAPPTGRVIGDFADSDFVRSHRLVTAVETRQGHTFCRNRALQDSTGDLIIWTDDDVTVSPNWVTRYIDAANNSPDFDFWGAAIAPRLLPRTPRWISRNWDKLQGCFAARDLGDQPIELTPDQLPYGANFAVRGRVQRQNHYKTELGRRGQEVLGEDEIELMRRLLQTGHRGQWIPGNAITHLIPAQRATARYIFEYFVGQGRALVARDQPWTHDPQQLAEEASAEWKRYRRKRWYTPSTTWCSHLIRSALARGQADALCDRT